MEDHMAAKANQSVDRVAQGKDENSARRHVAAIADSSGDATIISLAADGVIETWKQSAERPDGYAQAA
jgi:hypothetical protein